MIILTIYWMMCLRIMLIIIISHYQKKKNQKALEVKRKQNALLFTWQIILNKSQALIKKLAIN